MGEKRRGKRMRGEDGLRYDYSLYTYHNFVILVFGSSLFLPIVGYPVYDVSMHRGGCGVDEWINGWDIL